jgi:heme exporter protein A
MTAPRIPGGAFRFLMLDVRQLDITRGDRALIRGFDLQVTPGTLVLLTGSNGSGKTSLLRAICGLVAPAGGTISWNSEDVRQLREEYARQLIYVGHLNGLKDDLSPAENLAVLCRLAGIASTDAQRADALQQFGLAGREHLPVRVLSQGQRRRTALSRLALSQSLPLWILDEPFAALDSAATVYLQSVITQHLAGGGMAVISTHQDTAIEASRTLAINLGGGDAKDLS